MSCEGCERRQEDPDADAPGSYVRVGANVRITGCADHERELGDIVRDHARRAETARAHPPVFRCPRCGAVSSHPLDLIHGYCGRCHDWTAQPVTLPGFAG